MNKNLTAIVILNYKNYQETIDCINSLYETNTNDFSIIVVDNDSRNESLKFISDQFESKRKITRDQNHSGGFDIMLVENNVNAGYAAGNNIGLRIGYDLGFKYLMVLNNDTIFSNDSLGILINTLNSQDNILCVGPKLLKANGSIDFNCAKRRPRLTDFFMMSFLGRKLKTDAWYKRYYYLKENPNLNTPIPVDIISGSCMLFDSKKFKAIDFFDEKTFLYFEEAIITEKARLNKFQIFFDPTTSIIHLGAVSTKQNTYSNFALKCEYESAIHYLTNYRGLSKSAAKLICLGQKLYIPFRKFRNK